MVMKHNMSFARRTCHGWGSLNYSIQQHVKQKKRVKVRRQTVRGERGQIHARRILLTFTDGFSGRQRKFPPPTNLLSSFSLPYRYVRTQSSTPSFLKLCLRARSVA